MKRRILSTLLALCMVLALLPGTALAATLPDINDDIVFIKQAEGNTCTTASAAMALRRHAILDGDYEWDSITEAAVGEVAWNPKPQLSWDFTFRGMRVKTYGLQSDKGLTTAEEKRAYFIEELASHPEGIVIFDNKTPHAILLTDYDAATDTFYCADPLKSAETGRIPLTSCSKYIPGTSQLEKIGSINQVWIIIEGTSSGATNPHPHNFSTVEYEAAHPHKEYRKCSCGATEYTGNTVLVDGCVQCYPAEYTVSGQFYCVYTDGTEHIIPSGTCVLRPGQGRPYEAEIKNGRIVSGFKVPAGNYGVFVSCDTDTDTEGAYCNGFAGDITVSDNIDLGAVKVKLSVHTDITVRDIYTEEILKGFKYKLKGERLNFELEKEVTEIDTFSFVVGSTYTLEISKDGYLDLSKKITPYIDRSCVRMQTEVYLQPTRGDFGNGVQWKVEDGVLTFWGNGPIPDYDSKPPWAALGDEGLIGRVEIEPGITRIGDRMMYSSWSREGITVSIPDTVTSIGEVSLAFTELRNIEIPKSVASIEYYAFGYSKDLTIKFMGDAPELDERVFDRCTGITVLYPAGNSTWDKYIGQNLGADDNVTWQAYDPAPDPTPDPAPTPSPVVPVTPSQPVLPGAAGPESPATPEEPSASMEAAVSFTDVRGHWAEEAIAYVSAGGIMTGTGENTFAPESAMTRAMVWTVLARMSGQSVDGGDPWYALAQSWAVAASVSDGADANDSITREQLVTMLYRFAGSPEVGADALALLEQYADSASVSGWARPAMAWAVSRGVINGVDGALAPQSAATRAQVAAILARCCQSAE